VRFSVAAGRRSLIVAVKPRSLPVAVEARSKSVGEVVADEVNVWDAVADEVNVGDVVADEVDAGDVVADEVNVWGVVADEVNGKAGNLNNALSVIFPPGSPPSPTDVIAVFDCDQVCEPNFFLRTLPHLDESPSVALVISFAYPLPIVAHVVWCL
jgi:cellulose synthase/poly-beta-1,6-N-acetylglucosamine synthase-like glycosyltransferase